MDAFKEFEEIRTLHHHSSAHRSIMLFGQMSGIDTSSPTYLQQHPQLNSHHKWCGYLCYPLNTRPLLSRKEGRRLTTNPRKAMAKNLFPRYFLVEREDITCVAYVSQLTPKEGVVETYCNFLRTVTAGKWSSKSVCMKVSFSPTFPTTEITGTRGSPKYLQVHRNQPCKIYHV